MRITFRSPSGRAYHLETDRFNPNILTAGSPGRIRKVAKHISAAEIVEGDRGLTVVHGEYEGMPVSAFATGMGPASASITLPEAIELAEGPMTVLRLGTAGSLQSFVRPGHLVVSTGCVRDERTTQAVVGPEYPAIADPELVPVIIAAAERHGYGLWRNLWAGITHVKDDLYFIETPHFSPLRDVLKPRLDSYRRMGVLASSMEFSVYCILRDFYQQERRGRIAVGEILAVLSAPGESGPVEIEIDRSKLEDDIIRIGLDALLAVYKIRRGEDPGLDVADVIRRMIGSPSPSELRTS